MTEFRPSVETTIPCFYCGHVEGKGGRLPLLMEPDENDPRIKSAHLDWLTDEEIDNGATAPEGWNGDDTFTWHLPLSDSWAKCSHCDGAYALHDLVQAGGAMTAPSYRCRRCADPRVLVEGGYTTTTCWCERCTDKAWKKVAPTPRQRLSGTRSAATPEKSTRATVDPSAERKGRLSALLAKQPMTTAEAAAELGVEQRTVQRDVTAIGAVAVKDGKSVRWSMPADDVDER